VAVVGASGSGKSSLIRAGLLPYLYGGFLSHAGSHWRVAIFRPGGDPIKNLAVALNDPRILGQPAESAAAAAQSALLLEVSLRRSGLGLIDAVRLARLPEGEQMLIVVDQFEEFSICRRRRSARTGRRYCGLRKTPAGGEPAARAADLCRAHHALRLHRRLRPLQRPAGSGD
jgi:hypothetical protein